VWPTQTTTYVILCPACLEEEGEGEDVGAVIWMGETKVKVNVQAIQKTIKIL